MGGKFRAASPQSMPQKRLEHNDKQTTSRGHLPRTVLAHPKMSLFPLEKLLIDQVSFFLEKSSH